MNDLENLQAPHNFGVCAYQPQYTTSSRNNRTAIHIKSANTKPVEKLVAPAIDVSMTSAIVQNISVGSFFTNFSQSVMIRIFRFL